MIRCARVVLLCALAACGPEEPPDEDALDPAFPADYADTYTEVRDCRKSGDHNLAFVRILADPAALAPYENRSDPFPDGAVVLKEEYDATDATCSGELVGWTVMTKASSATERLGWSWQSVDAGRRVLENNVARCQNCHLGCDGTRVGYDYTCTDPG